MNKSALDRSVSPLVTLPERVHLPAMNKLLLQNGSELYALSAGKKEVVKIDLTFDGGNWAESKKIQSLLCSRLLTRGTQQRSANDLADALDFFGVNVQCKSYPDFNELSFHCQNKHLANVLPLIFEMLSEPLFDEDELRILKDEQLQRLSINREKVDYLGSTYFARALFGEQHPYGYGVEAEDIEAITTADIKAFHLNVLAHSVCRIFVSGLLSDKEIDLIASTFSKLPAVEGVSNAIAEQPIQPAERLVQRIEKPGAVQTAIRVGARLFTRAHEDYNHFFMLNVVLGGYFSSRLMSNIRETKGYTYGIYSQMRLNRREGFLLISTEVGKEVTEPTLFEISSEFKRLREELIDEEELQMVKNYVSGKLMAGVDGPFNAANSNKQLILSGLDNADFYSFYDAVKTTRPEQLMEMANKYLDINTMYQIAYG